MVTEKFLASIVIPTFNREEFLARAIQSAIDQTVPCEVIVVDHGSNDQTAKIARQYGSRILYIRRELDSGPVLAWIDGVHAASGEYVKLLFDDDWLEPEFVESAIPYFQENVGFFFSAASLVDHSGNPVRTLFTKEFPESGIFYSPASRRRVGAKLISPTALLMRRRDMLDGLLPGSLPFQSSHFHGAGADHFVKLLTMLRYPAFGYSNQSLANFQAHPGSITTSALLDPSASRALSAVYEETYGYFRFLEFSRRLGLAKIVAQLGNLECYIRRQKNRFALRMGRIRFLMVGLTRPSRSPRS